MPEGLTSTDFHFPNQLDKYTGKVREIYDFGNQLAMIATDRISAFDVVLPEPIPHKGQVLNQIAEIFLKATSDIVPNWFDHSPHPNVSIGKKCNPFPIEMVIRGYLTGHAWREYKEGKRLICGNTMPEGMKEHDKFPEPLITPTTKAQEGHDEDITIVDILNQGLVSERHLRKLQKFTLDLFAKGTEMAASQGLILVDTKYEFGLYGDEVYLIDEVHTPDSSRYFYGETYQDLQEKGEPQKQLSKEFVREWLIREGFQGKDGEQIPAMSESKVIAISERYIELFENITGQTFVKDNYHDKLANIKLSIEKAPEV